MSERTGGPERGNPGFVSDSSSINAQLSSVSTALTELTRRVAGLADEVSEAKRDGIAQTLFEIERSLQAANRRLDQLVTDLSSRARATGR